MTKEQLKDLFNNAANMLEDYGDAMFFKTLAEAGYLPTNQTRLDNDIIQWLNENDRVVSR